MESAVTTSASELAGPVDLADALLEIVDDVAQEKHGEDHERVEKVSEWTEHEGLQSQSAGLSGHVDGIAPRAIGAADQLGKLVAVTGTEPFRVEPKQPAGHAGFTATVRARMRSMASS